MSDRQRIAAAAGLVLAAVVIQGGRAPEATSLRDPARLSAAAWAEAATHACWQIRYRMGAFGQDHWRALGQRPAPLGRIAVLRRQLLRLQEDAARELRAHGPAPSAAATHALALHAYMLDTIRDVILAAERRDTERYAAAELDMVVAIEATRGAFARAGARHVCNFAI